MSRRYEGTQLRTGLGGETTGTGESRVVGFLERPERSSRGIENAVGSLR